MTRHDDVGNAARSGLRRRLVVADLACVAGAWSLAVGGIGWGSPAPAVTRRLLVLGLLVLTAAVGLVSQELYLARVCAVPAAERARLLRVGLLTGAVAGLGSGRLGLDVSAVRAFIGAACMTAFLVVARAGYAAWLRACRTQGRFTRPLVLIGTNDEAAALEQLVDAQGELGYRIVGVVGDQQEWSNRASAVPWLGTFGAASELAKTAGAGALIAITALSSAELNRLIRQLLALRVRVHTSSGMMRIDHRRIRALPFSHEPLYYIEPALLAGWQLALKRAIDLIGATVGLVLTGPLLLLTAVAVRLDSPGPAIFRQDRVGKDGHSFRVFKLRTMVMDAESLAGHFEDDNERRGGPLFKLDRDPRVTRLGRLLRSTSLDELPQLLNVLRGEMSLVGPRPALAGEVARFDEELLARDRVRPGITGLWQLEGRDNPAFSAYRRLDLFYVDNWSIGMDLAILMGTIAAVLGRSVRLMVRSRRTSGHDRAVPAIPALPIELVPLVVAHSPRAERALDAG
ncbi:MAG TPA: sugar transferase [Acidimicrobiales bacterium]|nr:sugar transferase [Acidimicrobiales bacterium]